MGELEISYFSSDGPIEVCTAHEVGTGSWQPRCGASIADEFDVEYSDGFVAHMKTCAEHGARARAEWTNIV